MHKENPQAKHTADNDRESAPFIDWEDLKDWGYEGDGQPEEDKTNSQTMVEGASYFIIQDLLTGGYWDELTQRFRGVGYAYRMDVSSELALNEEFQNARKIAKFGVRLVLVYS